MLRREVDSYLQAYCRGPVKKCLVIRGARQVGKTFSVRELAKSGIFSSYIEVNFLKNPELCEIFSGSLDTQSLLMAFSVYMPESRFVPGSTLLFLDEIQECPQAITSLKFWAEDGRFRVIASGSMLEMDYKRPTSYPVGSVQYLDMKPLGFREFLWALGMQDSVIDMLKGHVKDCSPVPEGIHEKLMTYLRTYMVVGGMPEVVQNLVDTRNLETVDATQRALLEDYRNDIAHYAPPEIKIKAEKCYFSIPNQLGKENHKFQYSVVERGGSARKFGDSIDWLRNADLVLYCCNVSNVKSPLRSFADEENFRLYPTDIGLLTAMYDFSVKKMILSEQTRASAIGQAKGALVEALVACMLTHTPDRQLYFYKNDSTHMELEFLLSSADGVIPVEVKAGNSRSRSLDRILEKDGVPYGCKLVSGNAGVTGKKRTLPLYMAMFL